MRDSAYFNTQYLNQDETSSTIYDYGNNINGIRIFYDPPQAPAVIEYHVNLPNGIMIVDSQGRRTGKNPITGLIYREIPGTSYNEDGLSPTNRVGEVYVSGATDNLYSLYILGGGDGPYWVTADFDDWPNGKLSSQVLRGNVQGGYMVAYEQKYNLVNLVSSTISYKESYSSTASITSELRHNLPLPLIPNFPPPSISAPAPSVVTPSATISTSSIASSSAIAQPNTIIMPTSTSSTTSSVTN